MFTGSLLSISYDQAILPIANNKPCLVLPLQETIFFPPDPINHKDPVLAIVLFSHLLLVDLWPKQGL